MEFLRTERMYVCDAHSLGDIIVGFNCCDLSLPPRSSFAGVNAGDILSSYPKVFHANTRSRQSNPQQKENNNIRIQPDVTKLIEQSDNDSLAFQTRWRGQRTMKAIHLHDRFMLKCHPTIHRVLSASKRIWLVRNGTAVAVAPSSLALYRFP